MQKENKTRSIVSKHSNKSLYNKNKIILRIGRNRRQNGEHFREVPRHLPHSPQISHYVTGISNVKTYL